ncbi:MAG: hypothetical protein MK212_04125 [Saprospiraceae bacterium]|nr:hypothetical protein [Saprospiraceae bacterium]
MDVRQVISDIKVRVDDNEDGLADAYEADVLQVSDAHPFGWTIQSRSKSVSNYRYSFNGTEKDDELNEGSYITTFRSLDSRIIRWRSIDPLTSSFPNQSPYNFSFNNPIQLADQSGAAPDDWVRRKNGNIEWDDNINSAADVGEGEQYLGKSFTGKDQNGQLFSFNSDGNFGKRNNSIGVSNPVSITSKESKEQNFAAWASSGMFAVVTTDFLLPEGTDLFPPKYIGWAGLLVTGGALWLFSDETSTYEFTSPALPSLSFAYTDAGFEGSIAKDFPKHDIKIALGLKEELAYFAAKKQAYTWFGTGREDGWGSEIKQPGHMKTAIKTLGALPNVTFHFNLSGSRFGRLDQPKLLKHFANDYTTIEYITIMNDPILRAKTTFYERKEDGQYHKVTPTPLAE